MKPQLLITYATRNGSTTEVAAAIAETARLEGDFQVTLKPVEAFESPANYDAVIIGSPIYADQWLPAAEDYLYEYHTLLAQKPVACFITCMVAANDNPESTTLKHKYREEAQTLDFQPLRVGIFAGKLKHDQLHGLEHWLVTVKGLPPGDYRDWAAIRQWAIETCEVLQEALSAS